MTDVIGARRTDLEDLCQRYGVARLALFGSALRYDFDPDTSDLDFTVEFQPMTPQEHAEAYFGLIEDLERLFGQRVDLVEIRAVRNPYLRREIDTDEQRAIAHILGTLDDRIELNRRMNKTLEAVARAIFKSWFVDFDLVHTKAEIPASPNT